MTLSFIYLWDYTNLKITQTIMKYKFNIKINESFLPWCIFVYQLVALAVRLHLTIIIRIRYCFVLFLLK